MASFFLMNSTKYIHRSILYTLLGTVTLAEEVGEHIVNSQMKRKGVQQALLKLVEGTVARVKIPGQMGKKIDIDTTDILFIASGAFPNLEEIVARRIDKRVLGFGATHGNVAEDLSSTDENVAATKKNELLAQANQSDLIK
ncbi:unnamed protein product [Strongylus vulgaris]|uniref:ATPase AAA-type core domain-containing protein n=1 Tax=Strongylus vulgaris TaxID=40348 RepID=A0A3P7LYS2_STRVU|nr:unnamed protein product [Strongylus vulgaris]